MRAARAVNASARGQLGIGPALGIAGHTLRAGHEGVDFCKVFGGEKFVHLAGGLVGFDPKHPGQRVAHR